MRSPRPVIGALGAAALVAALATAAPSQTTSESARDKDAGKSPATTASQSSSSSPMADLKTPLRLRAFAVNTNNTAGRAAGTLDIVVERWSSDAEVDKLRGVLKENPDKLLSTVQSLKPRAGYVRGQNTIGWDLHFAREASLPDGGHRIVLGSDRPMSFWELTNRPRSADYEFLLVEIHLDKDGKGSGTLAPAAMVNYDEDTKTLEVENFQNQPVRLTQVEVVKGGK
jgi:hypothetical protein